MNSLQQLRKNRAQKERLPEKKKSQEEMKRKEYHGEVGTVIIVFDRDNLPIWIGDYERQIITSVRRFAGHRSVKFRLRLSCWNAEAKSSHFLKFSNFGEE